jgi:hypothetical protein
MATSINNSAWLEWMKSLMGGVSRQSYAATLPPDRFHCLLDDLPLHLIPRRGRALLRRRNEGALFLNPECIFCSDGQIPDELQAQKELVSKFSMQGTTVWVREPATGSLLPFWLGPEMEGTLRNLRADEAAPPTLSDETGAVLAGADVLIPKNHAVENPRLWRETVGKAGELFRERGYAPLSDLIHPFHVAALRRYYRYLIRSGAIRLGDGQSPHRYVAYNEPVARFFHYQIAATISAVAGQPLKPSYVYLASYLSGAELKKHTDREQCEFSVTMCLDFSPEPVLETPWPIRLDTSTGKVAVYQALGDGLAYRGTRMPHYRDVLGEGQMSTSIFFHYVAADFAGSLD